MDIVFIQYYRLIVCYDPFTGDLVEFLNEHIYFTHYKQLRQHTCTGNMLRKIKQEIMFYYLFWGVINTLCVWGRVIVLTE